MSISTGFGAIRDIVWSGNARCCARCQHDAAVKANRVQSASECALRCWVAADEGGVADGDAAANDGIGQYGGITDVGNDNGLRRCSAEGQQECGGKQCGFHDAWLAEVLPQLVHPEKSCGFDITHAWNKKARH